MSNILGPAGFIVSPNLPPTMHRDAWVIDDFVFNDRLYKGGNSRCYNADDRISGFTLAVKVYRKKYLTKMNRFQVEREVKIQSCLQHPNIIALFAAFEDAENVYLIQELASGGDLFRKGGKSYAQGDEHKAVKQVMIPMLKALQYLHEKGVTHRDIKPENILITALGEIKLADFGLAINTNHERPVTRGGTMDYMAPEILLCPDREDPAENKNKWDLIYTEQVDIWAVGILAYELLEGKCPFQRETKKETLALIQKAEIDYPSWMSTGAIDFMKQALRKEASKRPSARVLLEHDWIIVNAVGHRKPSAASNTSTRIASFPRPSSLDSIKSLAVHNELHPELSSGSGSSAAMTRSMARLGLGTAAYSSRTSASGKASHLQPQVTSPSSSTRPASFSMAGSKMKGGPLASVNGVGGSSSSPSYIGDVASVSRPRSMSFSQYSAPLGKLQLPPITQTMSTGGTPTSATGTPTSGRGRSGAGLGGRLANASLSSQHPAASETRSSSSRSSSRDSPWNS